MSGINRSFSAWPSVALYAALTAICMPQPAFAQPAGHRSPQFVATAVKFKALHETHYNWMGSDEVQAVFYDFTGPGSTGTSVFGDVDAGETRNIAPEQSCISPQPRCDHGASSLGFGLALLEIDDWFFPPHFCHGALGDPTAPPPTSEEYERAFDAFAGADCAGDDLIGRAKVKLPQADLVAMLPTVGAFVDTTITLTGGAGRYEMTYRLTRLADRFNIPPIGPPVVLNPISLSATVVVGIANRVMLTWSGATTNTVDIYRNGTKLTTTANDGTFLELMVAAGTYQYRVCNLGSTVCSADVQVVVS